MSEILIYLFFSDYFILGGRHNINIRTLQGSGGWLGGLGRRVSSLFFSAMPSSQSVETVIHPYVHISW